MSLESFSIPVSQADRFEFQRNAYQIIPNHADAWDIPAETIAKLTTEHNDYEDAYLLTSNIGTQNPIATAKRDSTWSLLITTLSGIYEKYILYNDAVDESTREALHIHYLAGGGAGTISPAPRTTPVLSLSSKAISVLHGIYNDSATPSTHAKPDGVAFCEFAFKVDLPVPETPKDCPERYFLSRSNTAIVFGPEQRGKRVNGFARWVNKNSKTGPWSGIITAIIP